MRARDEQRGETAGAPCRSRRAPAWIAQPVRPAARIPATTSVTSASPHVGVVLREARARSRWSPGSSGAAPPSRDARSTAAAASSRPAWSVGPPCRSTRSGWARRSRVGPVHRSPCTVSPSPDHVTALGSGGHRVELAAGAPRARAVRVPGRVDDRDLGRGAAARAHRAMPPRAPVDAVVPAAVTTAGTSPSTRRAPGARSRPRCDQHDGGAGRATTRTNAGPGPHAGSAWSCASTRRGARTCRRPGGEPHVPPTASRPRRTRANVGRARTGAADRDVVAAGDDACRSQSARRRARCATPSTACSARSHSCQATAPSVGDQTGSHAESACDRRWGQSEPSRGATATSQASSCSSTNATRSPPGATVGAAAWPSRSTRRPSAGDVDGDEAAVGGRVDQRVVARPAVPPAAVRPDRSHRELGGEGQRGRGSVGGGNHEVDPAPERVEPRQAGATGDQRASPNAASVPPQGPGSPSSARG